MSDLLPCPFCGHRASITSCDPKNGDELMCFTSCEICYVTTPTYPTEQVAKYRWNKRVVPADLLERLRKLELSWAATEGSYMRPDPDDVTLAICDTLNKTRKDLLKLIKEVK